MGLFDSLKSLRERLPRLAAGFVFCFALASGLYSQFKDQTPTPPQIRESLQIVKQGKALPHKCSKNKMTYRVKDFVLMGEEISFLVDASNARKKSRRISPSAALKAIQAAGNEWRSHEEFVPKFVGKISKLHLKNYFAVDGKNMVSWQDLSSYSTDTRVAVHLVIDVHNKNLVEFDVALDQSVPWSVNKSTQLVTGTNAGAYDLQNAITNAFGHVLGLGDVSDPEDCGLSMYPFILPKETIKRKIGTGDLFGIRYVYSNRR